MKISCRRKSQLVVSISYQLVTDPCCGLSVIFCGFILHLIGRETINIAEMMGLKTIWELFLFQEVANGDFFCFLTETGVKRVAMETALRVSFCFFFDAHLWCLVSRTLLQYFWIYRLFSISPLFSFKQNDVITDLICIIEKRRYL